MFNINLKHEFNCIKIINYNLINSIIYDSLLIFHLNQNIIPILHIGFIIRQTVVDILVLSLGKC